MESRMGKMQIKLFKGKDINKVEREVNDFIENHTWMLSNKKVNIHSVDISSISENLVVCVFYEKI
jgi:hypothetical protein